MTIGLVPAAGARPTVAVMTEINGLRLAYRGFVTGLAAAYVWLAVAMSAAGFLAADPLAPLRPLASTLVVSGEVTPALAFVIGFAMVQAAGGLVGMCFAYFFGRFFTVRRTMSLAAPVVALLAWALLAAGVGTLIGSDVLALQLAPVLASVAYGAILGIGVPIRAEVTRSRP